MKMECEVIRDLLPLYADDACSEQSRFLVDEHLAECADCRGMLLRLRETAISASDTDELSDRLNKLYDLIEMLENAAYLMEFDESVFRLVVEKIVALPGGEVLFRIGGGLKFKERIER